MNNLKPFLIPSLIIIWVISMIIYATQRNIAPHYQLFSYTCLNSDNANMLRDVYFHSTMVHEQKPETLDHWVRNKTGFEIGGPSREHWGRLGVYDTANRIDITNFASSTLWENKLVHNSSFIWNGKPKGIQYIRDAIDLHDIPDNFYDFVLASHVLEHIANPFKALLEWLRILRSKGLLLIIVPLKEITFDHNRAIIQIEHLIADYHNHTAESDLSHLSEILQLHDLKMDPPAGDLNFFKNRSVNNFLNRGLHQHVYDQQLMYHIFICLNIEVKIQYTWHGDQLIIGQKR